MALFEKVRDYSRDIFRNIRGIKVSQDLFDDLSEDPLHWEAANILDMHTRPALRNASVIQRAFDYSQNDFIDYPFENITASRYSNGIAGCWYGSESLYTTIYETRHHFIQEIYNCPEIFSTQKTIIIDRRVAEVHCEALALDISHKAKAFPWLIDPVNYTSCQQTGQRVANEGHPLLRVPSARHEIGVNLVVFNPDILSNSRQWCNLQYTFEICSREVTVYKGGEIIPLEPAFVN